VQGLQLVGKIKHLHGDKMEWRSDVKLEAMETKMAVNGKTLFSIHMALVSEYCVSYMTTCQACITAIRELSTLNIRTSVIPHNSRQTSGHIVQKQKCILRVPDVRHI
jgi:hypothetical protein